jgi:hypothetical protein
MESEITLSRPIWRSICFCSGAQWYSLRKLSLLLEAVPHKTKTAQVAWAISRRAQRRLDRAIECIPLPDNLAEVELDIEIGFQHLTHAEHYLLLKQERGAQHHSTKFVDSLLAAARKTGKPIAEAEAALIEIQCRLLTTRLQSQIELKQAIRNRSLPAQITFVLGMHRSGTSALGGLLCQSGLDAPTDLMIAHECNKKGFWESIGLFLMNEKLLAQLGTTWDSIYALPLGWENLPETIAWREEVLHHLKKVFYEASHPMIKDPRFCILLPGLTPWLESDLVAFSFLLPIRHPYEVARSLAIAQGISEENSIRLWLMHVFASERISRGYPRYIVSFENILMNPEEVIKRCRSVTAQTREEPAMEYPIILEKSLRHQVMESVRADIEDATVRIGTERQIALQLFDLLASSNESEPLITATADDLYCLWQTLG